MAILQQIQSEQFEGYLSKFTSNNLGKLTTLEYLGEKLGETGLVHDLPLLAIEFLPPEKGNNLTINLGRETIQFSHTVNAPIELLEIQNDSGRIMTLEIIDHKNNKTVLSFAR